MPDGKDCDPPFGIQRFGSSYTIFVRQHGYGILLFQSDRQHHLTARQVGYRPPVHLHGEGKTALRGEKSEVKDAVGHQI